MAEADLRDDAAVTAELIRLSTQEVNRVLPAEDRRPAARLAALRRGLDVDGVGFLVIDANHDVVAAMSDPVPDGVPIDQLDLVALRQDRTVSGGRGNEVWAAASIQERPGFAVPVVVLTRSVDPLPGTSFRWFLLAAAATMAVGVLVAGRVARALARPVRDAEVAATRIAGGDLSARVPVGDGRPGDDELDALARAVNDMAAALARSRGLERQFLLSVSHDLRTPLTSIRGYAEAIADGAADDPAAAAGTILGESRRLERLVGDLLDLARLDARHFTLRPVVVDLARVAADSVDGFGPEAEGAGLRLTLEAPPDPVPVVVDVDRLQQVVANLVDNASRFARTEIQVTVTADPPSLAVADDGPGIAPDDLAHVFERLYVASAVPVRKESGSGLGLAIAKELVEAMGGTIDATSTVGRGARLVLRLPPAPAGGEVAQVGDGPGTSGSDRTSAAT